MLWIDYTRRSDPAHPAGVERLKAKLGQEGYPRVFCFWTKAPKNVAVLYRELIAEMKQNGTMVLAQVTLNGYRELEPGIRPEFTALEDLVALLGDHKHVRARFDPIIPGYTTPGHFKRHLQVITEAGIEQTTINFLVPSYKDVGKILRKRKINFHEPIEQEKLDIANRLKEMADKYGVKVAVCAESAEIAKQIPGILRARCADPEWAWNLDVKENFSRRPSRKGCGCVYSDDWGEYHSRGGYRCPHGCLYCYAK